MEDITDMVAAVLDDQQRELGRYLIGVPKGMDLLLVQDQVRQIALADGTLKPTGDGMTYVSLRPADPDGDADLYDAPPPTIH